jgi:geranylgeranyl pyrophosphate synthase
MSTVIEHLVRGGVLQIKDNRTGVADIEGYLRKNFYKTTSLMAYSCKSAALLGAGGHANVSPEVIEAAYRYGKHIGVAFQLIDDALDFDGSAASLGKPALADIHAGLSTAPVLFAAESYRELLPAIVRKFKEDGDVDLSLRYIEEARGVRRTKKLAAIHAELAIDAVVNFLEPSPYRDALVHLACRVVDRSSLSEKLKFRISHGTWFDEFDNSLVVQGIAININESILILISVILNNGPLHYYYTN